MIHSFEYLWWATSAHTADVNLRAGTGPEETEAQGGKKKKSSNIFLYLMIPTKLHKVGVIYFIDEKTKT